MSASFFFPSLTSPSMSESTTPQQVTQLDIEDVAGTSTSSNLQPSGPGFDSEVRICYCLPMCAPPDSAIETSRLVLRILQF